MKIRTKLTLRYLTATVLLGSSVFFLLEELLYPQAGYDMFRILNIKLLAIWTVSFTILFIIGYFMARSLLNPISKIIRQVKAITASNLSKRVEIDNPKDELGELAITLNDTLDRLEKSFESQKMFLSNISHELRTPLTALIGELELSLCKERTKEDYKTIIERALDDANNIDKLFNGLADLAKASYNTDQIRMTPIRLDEALLDASAIVMKARNNYNVDLIFGDISNDDRMVTIYGYEPLLRTAFVNLMENNCKFSNNHSSTIRISFSRGMVCVNFSDTGIGMSHEDMQQIFQPFYRGKNHYFSAGNGIGMTLVERIVKLHNGTISINSLENEGTTFILTFNHI
jgi:signal transduction histidine kinase